jgi:hypothetical protein
MNEQELRRLVREAIARHPGVSAGEAAQPLAGAVLRLHASHGMFTLPAGADTDGPCLIEPAVMCNHCGYCKSWGH